MLDAFWKLVVSGKPTVPENMTEAAAMAMAIGTKAEAIVYPISLTAEGGVLAAIARRKLEKSLLVLWPAGKNPAVAKCFSGAARDVEMPFGKVKLLEAPRTAETAAALRKALPWTCPQLIAGRPSIGLGDRLGLATPGHVRAVREANAGYVPMLAQQSIREMTRTQRSAQQVIDDATWGVFQTGFRTGYGADADHLKTPADIDRCAAVGFTFFTIDPGDHVDNSAADLSTAALAEKFEALPWSALETTASDTLRAYARRREKLGSGEPLVFSETVLRQAAVKYGCAVAHTTAMYRHLVETLGTGKFELEVSVDETELPTSAAEHFYVAQELRRLGVEWVSLAPRFVGRFEKGVDYLGDLKQLERTFVEHLAIAERFGRYKISLHSGSDKFSVYEMAARHAGRHVHVKTAGTSYLEALRVIARCEPALFREILDFARERYETDKASYHVSATLSKVPASKALSDERLPSVLDQFDGREALHVTFGSVLTADDGARFRGRLMDALRKHEEDYSEALRVHIGRHLAPFVKA